jgi:hypothetical protein
VPASCIQALRYDNESAQTYNNLGLLVEAICRKRGPAIRVTAVGLTR